MRRTMPGIACSGEIRAQAVDRRQHGPSISRRDGDKVMRKERVMSFMCRVVIALVLIALPAVIPDHAWAAVNCTDVIGGGPTGPLANGDADGDGLTDFQECSGIVTPGQTPLTVPSCFVPGPIVTIAAADRSTCLDPDSKDLFVIYKPATTGSLLGGVPRPFDNATITGTNISVAFTGLSALGVTVHQITEAQAGTGTADRSVTSTQKAIKVTESLDP